MAQPASPAKSKPPNAPIFPQPSAGKHGYRFTLNLFGNSGENSSPEYRIELNIGAGGVPHPEKARRDKRKSQPTLASGSCNQLRSSNPATFDFYIDRSGNLESALYVDGTRWKTWTHKISKDEAGHWFHIRPGNETKLRLSQIAVTNWNGKLPDNAANTKTKELQRNADDDEFEKLEGQHIKLRNGDTIVGSIKKITKNNLLIHTTYGDINVPVARALNIALGHDQLHQPIMKNGDVRAHFHNGGYITFVLKNLTTDTITGYSQVFGEVKFKLNAFSRIQFNVWKNKGEPDTSFEESW